MKIYTEPGRARKQCQTCKVFFHVRCKECPKCNDSVNSLMSKVVDKVFKRYDGPGIGRKQCSGCKIYVHSRVKVCPECKQEFIKLEKPVFTFRERVIKSGNSKLEKAKKDMPDINIDDRVFYAAIGAVGNCRMVLVPKGKCPVNLNCEDINLFCDDVVQCGLENNMIYTPRAIKYFLSQFLDINSSKFKTYSSLVDTWYKNKVDSWKLNNVESVRKMQEKHLTSSVSSVQSS